jgi:hypothetical protein
MICAAAGACVNFRRRTFRQPSDEPVRAAWVKTDEMEEISLSSQSILSGEHMANFDNPRHPPKFLTHVVRVFDWFSKCILALASVSMCAVSVALVIASLLKAAVAFSTMPAVQSEILESVSLVVIAVAIIDVAKYILEEEVLRDRELREPAEAREAITKFIVVIALVIAIESIVFIFNLGHSEPDGLIYPALLLLVFVAMVVGLGFYQKLSLAGERQLQSMHHPESEGHDDVSPQAPTRAAPESAA